MPSPTFQAVGAIASSNTLSPSAVCPVTTTTGRLIIWHAQCPSSATITAFTPPAGFTARINAVVGSVRLCVATKTGVVGDSGATLTGSATGTAAGSSRFVTVYDNYDTSFAGTWVTSSGNGTMSTTSVVMPTLTTNVNDATLYGIFVDAFSLSTFTPAAGMTERVDSSLTAVTAEVADEARATAGATGTRTAVASSSTTAWSAWGLQLPGPAAAGGAASLIFEPVSSLHRTLRSM